MPFGEFYVTDVLARLEHRWSKGIEFDARTVDRRILPAAPSSSRAIHEIVEVIPQGLAFDEDLPIRSVFGRAKGDAHDRARVDGAAVLLESLRDVAANGLTMDPDRWARVAMSAAFGQHPSSDLARAIAIGKVPLPEKDRLPRLKEPLKNKCYSGIFRELLPRPLRLRTLVRDSGRRERKQ